MRIAKRLALACTLALTAAAPAAAQVDETCGAALTRSDADTLNIAFPDDSASYWGALHVGVPGSRLRIEGRFPHARYFSFNVYEQQAPVDVLTDAEIVPDAGSSNPFVTGADRGVAQRSYTAYVLGEDAPAQPAANTLYAGAGNPLGVVLYRIYVPDTGRGETGGVGLPRIVRELPGGGEQEASLIDCTETSKPKGGAVNEAVAGISPPAQADVLPVPGYDPPRWGKFVNLGRSVAGAALGNEYGEPLYEAYLGSPLADAGGSGGFLSNIDNAYVTTAINRSFGQVLMVRGRAPGFADTRTGAPTMPAADLRYWSICQNEFVTQRFIACANDDRVVVGDDGFFTIVVSTPAQRPANATVACGVTWLPWGPATEGVLIYRHMLPAAGFAAAIHNAQPREEAATMGDYLPVGEYFAGKAAFEARGC